MRPLTLRESLVFSVANFGSNLVYQFFNFGAGLYLYRASFVGAAVFVGVSFLLLLTVNAPHRRAAPAMAPA